MAKLMYKQLLFSKHTVFILLILLATSVLSFGYSFMSRLMWINLVETGTYGGSLERTLELIENYNGTQFIREMWFNPVTEAAVLKIILLIAWIGVYFTAQLQIERENGFGNLVITRSSYAERFRNILLSQTLYIVTVMFVYVFLSVLLAFLVGGVPSTGFRLGDGDYIGRLSLLGTYFAQFVWLSVMLSAFNAFSLVCSAWIRHKLLLRILPFLLYIIIPDVVGTIIGNTFPATAPILWRYVSGGLISLLEFVFFQPHLTALQALFSHLGVVTSLVAFLILYRPHIKKGSVNYL